MALQPAGASGSRRAGILGRARLLDIAFALPGAGHELGIFRAMLAEQTLTRMRLRNLVEGVGQLGLLRPGRARIGHRLLPVSAWNNAFASGLIRRQRSALSKPSFDCCQEQILTFSHTNK
jgi:hypothetical protein